MNLVFRFILFFLVVISVGIIIFIISHVSIVDSQLNSKVRVKTNILDPLPLIGTVGDSFACPTRIGHESAKIILSLEVMAKSIRFSSIISAPFSDDPKSVAERSRTEYPPSIPYLVAVSGRGKRAVRVYTDGIYDLFHGGHGGQLMQAKNLFPNVHLIVGVCNDSLTHQLKGCTILSDLERYDSVRHCRYVDEVVRNAPWEISNEFLNFHKIDFVVHGQGPIDPSGGRRKLEWGGSYATPLSRGMFLETKRGGDLSTSSILKRILTNHQIYTNRNHNRKFFSSNGSESFTN